MTPGDNVGDSGEAKIGYAKIGHVESQWLAELRRVSDGLISALRAELDALKTERDTLYQVIVERDKVIHRMKEEMGDGWVSVELALPGERGGYIVFPIRGDWERAYFDGQDFYMAGHRELGVTHWRELPSPPGVEGKDKI